MLQYRYLPAHGACVMVAVPLNDAIGMVHGMAFAFYAAYMVIRYEIFQAYDAVAASRLRVVYVVFH